MKPLFLITASALALTGLGACSSGKAPVARAALDCPQVEGDLTRASQATDGKTCVYRTPGGDEITLQLVATGGDPEGALRGVEADLMGPVDKAAADAKAASDKAASASAKAAGTAAAAGEAAAAAGKDAAKAADDAAKDAATSASSDNEEVNVHLPGIHVEAQDGGKHDKARISLPGVQIIADDANDSADIRVGGMHILAHDNQATIRLWKDVRLRGEAFSRQKRGLRATFIRTGESMPDGYRLVGYEAAGPKAGPITVATVRARDGDDLHDRDSDIYKDVRKLVRRNGGV